MGSKFNLGTALLAGMCTWGCSGGVDGDTMESAEGEWLGVARSNLGSTEPVTSISTLADLRQMTPTGNYRLANNITMQSTDAPFVPIGSHRTPFRGTFDGNGFVIRNLRINDSGWFTGMFRMVIGAVLHRVRLENVNVEASSYAGAIAGTLSNSELTDSYVTGTVTGATPVGMAVGFVGSNSRLERSYATGTVTGPAEIIGGFIGEIAAEGEVTVENDPRAHVAEIFTNVDVNPFIGSSTPQAIAGGLVGRVRGAVIQNINTVGPVYGWGPIGGVVGQVINEHPSSARTILVHAISRGLTRGARQADPAGPIGGSSGSFARCISFYDRTLDTGTPSNQEDSSCNAGMTTRQLREPHPSPNRYLGVYILGQLVTQAMIDAGGYQQCLLGSGSDLDWGFGTCGTPRIWALNSSSEYNTLVRIPNPGVQPR